MYLHAVERQLFRMGDGVREPALGKHCRRMASGGGMEAQRDDKLWTKSGEFYVDDGVEALVCSGGIHAS